ncbi:hypothetical protein [Candidatus Carsonella ruddii]|uniref:hypothetical protein n=1 Tax=Carsonella ruddii TaxID=114186 RepID=UPI0012BC93D6|nr:hypothetical protein [Candidatus Carsonella ruddii]
MLKIKILILKIYSFSNYKTNVLNLMFKKKKYSKNINLLYYLINNFIYIYKKNISSLLYLTICNYYSEINTLIYNRFLFFKKNIYSLEIFENYNLEEIFFFLYRTKLNKTLTIKSIKKIYTNVLFKIGKNPYETLIDRYTNTFLYSFINVDKKVKNILKFYISYTNENFFYFLKNIKKVCLLIHSSKEEYGKKIYIGMQKNSNNKFPHYLYYLINILFKKKMFKINISLEIYNFDFLKMLKMIKDFKKLKLNIIIGIPDLFIEYVIKKKNWYLFDSIEIKKKYSFFLQSFYDEYIGYGSFRNNYEKVLKNCKILKISINSNKILKFIIKNNVEIIFTDKTNRNNINKHISCLLPNFFHSKIFDRNNYFNRKLFYLKNVNICLQRNNISYLEIKLNQSYTICRNSIKNFFLKFKILNIKNDFFIIQKESNFHYNYRLKPILFEIELINKKSHNYLIYNLIKINTFIAKDTIPYCWYPGSDIYNYHFFFRNNYSTNKWKTVMNYIHLNKIKCSLNINIKNKKSLITTFDNFYLKSLILKWQLNENNKL